MNKLSTPGIRFIVTSLCNYDCVYCHNEWEPKRGAISKLEKKLIYKLISAAKDLGAREVDITGGEPLLKIDRVEAILSAAKDLELYTCITTNGYFLSKFKERLQKSGLKEIHVHVPSLKMDKYERLMRGNSDLGVVLKGLEEIKGLFEVIKANIPIKEKVNDDEIPDFLEHFSVRGIIPRFIESMSTFSYKAGEQISFEALIRKYIGEIKLVGSYLWGINKYDSISGKRFETLRCICFDKKCTICTENNFIHVDQEYKIRPCNLRPFKIQTTEGGCSEAMKEALDFLSKQTDIPKEYKDLWGNKYIPLVNIKEKNDSN